MKLISKNLLFSLICLTIISCSKEDDTLNLNPWESYRYSLWKKFIDTNIDADFVGTQVDSYAYPDYMGASFDVEHQGVGSIETEGVIISLRNVLLSIESPDVVLLGIGINDLLADNAPAEITRNVSIIINMLRTNNPNVTIFIEQIPPVRSDLMSSDLETRLLVYNAMISRLSFNKSRPNSKIIAIDMYSDFSEQYFADQAHFNAEGAEFVSQKYFEAIVEHCDLDSNLKILPLGDSRVVGYKE